MRTFLVIAGGGFLVILLLFACFLGYAFYIGADLDASSKAYVEVSVSAVASTWSTDEVMKRASPELLAILKEHPAQFEQTSSNCSRMLGGMQRLNRVTGGSTIFYTNVKGQEITANYVASLKCEKGDAEVSIRLIQLSGKWKILLFSVNSPLFDKRR